MLLIIRNPLHLLTCPLLPGIVLTHTDLGVILDPHEFTYLLSVVNVVTSKEPTSGPEPKLVPHDQANVGTAGAGEEGGGGAGSAEAVATAGGEEKVAAGSCGSGGPSDGKKETEAAGAAAPTEVVQQKQQKQGRHGQGTGKRKQKAVVVETLRFGIVPAAGYWNYKPSSTLAAGHVVCHPTPSPFSSARLHAFTPPSSHRPSSGVKRNFILPTHMHLACPFFYVAMHNADERVLPFPPPNTQISMSNSRTMSAGSTA